jgi:hypothetical protein
MAVTMKNAVFRDVTPCGSCKNRRFGGTHRLHHQGDKNRRARNNGRLLVKANGVPSSPILVTLMTEALSSSETSVLTRATRRNIPEDGFFQTFYFLALACCETSEKLALVFMKAPAIISL